MVPFQRLACLAPLMLAPAAAAAETCRYSGAADHGAAIAVTSVVTRDGNVVTTDITLDLTASYLFQDVRYLLEELATFRSGEVQTVAVNARAVVNGAPRRQQWDLFVRTPGGLAAQRVQAKSLESFRSRHPGFVAQWDLAAFGTPWLPRYAAAPPDRRADLDLPAANLAAGLRPSFALAFYWSRWLPRGGLAVPVFLPGFKHDALAEAAFGAATPSGGGRAWRATLSHPGLVSRAPSTAIASVSPNGDLDTLAFDLHSAAGSASGAIHRDGCEGAAVPPG